MIQKLVRKRKRQDQRVTKKKISATDSVQKKALQNKWVLFLLSIRMSEKTLKFDNIRLAKKEFFKSKLPIDLMFVNID